MDVPDLLYSPRSEKFCEYQYSLFADASNISICCVVADFCIEWFFLTFCWFLYYIFLYYLVMHDSCFISKSHKSTLMHHYVYNDINHKCARKTYLFSSFGKKFKYFLCSFLLFVCKFTMFLNWHNAQANLLYTINAQFVVVREPLLWYDWNNKFLLAWINV